jgi:hypothetical protein
MWDVHNEIIADENVEGLQDFMKGTPGLQDIGANLSKLMHSDSSCSSSSHQDPPAHDLSLFMETPKAEKPAKMSQK